MLRTLVVGLLAGLLSFSPIWILQLDDHMSGHEYERDMRVGESVKSYVASLGSNHSLTYPDQSLSEMRNATALATDLLSRLDLDGEVVPSTSPPQEPATLIGRRPPSSEYFDGFLAGYQVASFVNLQEQSVDLYYSISGGSSELLLAADIRLTPGSLAIESPPPYSSAALAIGALLGLPMSNASIVSYQNTSDRVTVIYSSLFDGLDLVGFNLAAFTFNIKTGALLEIQFRPFLDISPSELAVSAARAQEIASESVRQELTSSDVLAEECVRGIRLIVPTVGEGAYQGGNDTTDGAVPGAEIRLAYEYSAVERSSSDEQSDISVIVLVDCSTGKIMLTSSGWTPVPMDHGYIDAGWIWVPLGFIALFLIVMFFVSPEVACFVMGSYLIVAYIRLRGAAILDNFNRGRIMGYISAKPGASFTEIRDSLKIVNGNLAYHLAVLEKLEFISSQKQGRSRRFFPIGVASALGENHFLGKTESRILEQLSGQGPQSNSDIAVSLGMSRQRTHYNLKLLRKRGLVDQSGSFWDVKPEGVDSAQHP